jgi:hypothetical protein
MLALAREKLVRDLEQNAGTITSVSFATASAPMVQVQEHLNRLFDNPARTATLDVNNEAQPARVMLELRVVKSLL